MTPRFSLTRRAARAGGAVAVAALLIGGATWHGFAAGEAASTPVHPAQVATASQAHAVAGDRDSYADVVDVVAPAVVTVRAQGRARYSDTQLQVPDDDLFRQFFGQRAPRVVPHGKQTALGSGVVVTADGYILTNNHVIDGADSVTVDFTDGRSLTARVVGTDKPSDLALLKVDGAGFKSAALGNSDAVRVGDVVLAIGNPLNVGQTVTMGIISAKGRSTGDGTGFEDFLQTDAPINHGNSGGALVNTKGELVGINSQILSNSDGNIGIGFAIPVNMARRVMEDLRTKGKVTRGQLGVAVQNVSPDIASSLGLKQSNGVIVSSVTPGSAADRAGLKRGDVLLTFDGQPVHDMNALRNHVADAGPGASADLLIVRDGVETHVTAKLDELDAKRFARGSDSGERDAEPGSDSAALGVTVTPLSPDVASRLGVAENVHGLVVENVDPDGRAADAGIRSGDVIEEANRQPVKTVEDLRAAIRRTNDRPTLLLVHRQGADIFVTVKPAKNG